MKEATVYINGKKVIVSSHMTILKAAKSAGFSIPHLCNDKRLEPYGACRMCIVEIKGVNGFVAACHTKVRDGMEITTDSEDIRAKRKFILELLLSDHPRDCVICDSDGNCKLQRYAYEYGVELDKYNGETHSFEKVNDANLLVHRDPAKCILCGRCVRICDEVVGAEAIDFANRGFKAQIATPYHVSLLDTTCELCGQCVSSCPTGSLSEKMAIGKGRAYNLKKVRTTCPYCGVGCTFDINVNDKGKIIKITSETGSVPNNGNLCVKGRFAYDFIEHPERLRKPLMKKGDKLVEVEWDEAISTACTKMLAIKEKYGAESLGFVSSCRCTNEENYLMQKLARAVFGSANIDQCARTCHAPTVAGLSMSFGSGAMTNSIEEISAMDLIFVIGSNPTEAHPIIGMEMKRAMRRGAQLIVVDPRRTWMAERASVHLALKPGTDVPLMNAMMHTIISEDIYDKEFVQKRTEDFDKLKEMVLTWPPERAALLCQVEAEDIKKAARMYAKADKAGIFYTLGLTEHICGTDNVRSTANLAMLTGHIGRESTGVNPLRGQNNVQGGCDMGALPDVFSGYQKVEDPAINEKFSKAYGVKLPDKKGYTITDMIEKADEGKIKALFIMGEDNLMSEPDSGLVKQAFEKLELLIVQDIFLSETAKIADVVFAASSYAEKDGTFTNTERRVQRVRKAIEPVGDSRPDWQILCNIAKEVGYDKMTYNHPSQIWDEMAQLTPIFAGVSYERIEKIGLQWPCFDFDHCGTKFLHEGNFTRGKGKFFALDYRPPAEEPNDEYPFYLTTGRILYHYNVGTMTLRSKGTLQKAPENFCELNFHDAQKIGVRDGEKVKIITRRGELTVKANVGEKVRRGRLWMPFHYPDSPTNLLTNSAFDDITRTAEYKVCAARIVKP
ncbi:MAG: formate dehydrogenase subunit alpha [Candidatus Omnitrophota bacterium]|nr:formate dehydrogenase subunit alpha [Candidatus Omnitrophota bacterium]